ncbi:glycosyltransferase [Terrilactibacillus laevilacticus]|uniref:CDP-glycerol glycerophosphotransferase family protein n=1 Tax=Terrilactibacillus laevilacticus TaxID=1380157 RepID=A0ABW5PQB9_9BACI|nr:glycosyltransferase [Terrilactibacillus laevilacticus]
MAEKTRKIIKRKIKFVLDPLKKYIQDQEFRMRATYTKFLERKPIKEKTILYEAYHGQSMTGNSYAVFKYLMNHPVYKNYTHVWALKDENTVHEEYKNKRNVIIVKPRSRKYNNYLATAKYLINDTTFPYYFQKRKEQIYTNIWHGTPLKHMGLDIKNRGLTDHRNIQHNFLYTDFMVNPNKFTYETLLKSHDVYNIYSGYVMDTGYPRIDLMFNADKDAIRKKLSIPEGKKVILYAPTWRGKLNSKNDMSETLMHEMDKLKNDVNDEYIILLKTHYYAYEFFKKNGLSHLCVPNSMDTNELLSIVDILITDYSSIFFDYLPKRKPVIFYAYDAEEYEFNRGMYIDMEDLPGPFCKDFNSVVSNINNIDNVTLKYKERYEYFINKFNYNDDGNATKRLVETIFEGKSLNNCFKTCTNKIKILIYCGGFFNNGITTSVTNLLNNIDYNKYDVTAVDYGNDNRKEKWENLAKINKNVSVLYRVGTWNAKLFEWCRHRLLLRRGAYTDFMKKVMPSEMYEREMKRLIGQSAFDIGIDFSGYSPFWTTLFAFGDFKKRSIYLHNDMVEQANKKVNNKYPHRNNLKVVFSLYRLFDKVVSVSKLTNEQNIKNFSDIIDNYQTKMDFVINNINYNKTLELKEIKKTLKIENHIYLLSKNEYSKSNINLSGFEIPKDDNINFINIGRLEPEKDQEKLLYAFSEIVKIKQNTKLYIVGQGALKGYLEKLVKSLDLEDHVIFTGQISNPYALLDYCDCFVLSSNHEGQPMVLLEALILDKPIIVTNIPGSRSVVEGGYGTIVDNSIQGLVDGMTKFISGQQMNEKTFDYKEYSKQAINMFYDKICSLK